MTKQGGWPSTGFGARLRVLRKGAGLSQSELAERAGCNKFTIAKMERGLQEPAWPLVLALCKALGVACTAFAEAVPGSMPGRLERKERPPGRGQPRTKAAKAKRQRKERG